MSFNKKPKATTKVEVIRDGRVVSETVSESSALDVRAGDPSGFDDFAAQESLTANECIYCGSQEDLSDEHILAYALGGTVKVKKGSCERCRQITHAFETAVLEGPMEMVRYIQNLPSRTKHRDEEDLRGIAHDADGDLSKRFVESLPFKPTNAQTRAMQEIGRDMAKPRPMHRLLQGDVGSGKAQPIDAKVLTPSGFKLMGDLHVGDEVVTPSGEITVITGVFPQGVRDVWELRFSDGTSAEADTDHLWVVGTSTAWHRGNKLKVKTTAEIRDDLCNLNGSAKWHLPVAEPVDLENGEDRPLDPYALGLLLGDGGLKYSPVIFTSADDELVRP